MAYVTPFDTKRPLNLNDADLHPNMMTCPTERQGSTEMMFCSVRYVVSDFVQQLGIKNDSPQNKLQAIQKLEQDLGDRFARHCDESIPLQRVTKFLIKTIGYRLTLMHCCLPLTTEENPSREYKTQTLSTALLLLQTQNVSSADVTPDRYRWHTKLFHNSEALFPVLRALAFDNPDQEALEEAWKQVSLTYHFNPRLLSPASSDQHGLYSSLASLAPKAITRHSQMDASSIDLPATFIEQLMAQQQPHTDPEATTVSASATIQQPAQPSDPALSEPVITEGQPNMYWQQSHLDNDDQAWEYWLNSIENEENLGF
ncbi:unnamed protein product [Aureobasidium vineae]|uniref:Uncharacterized protein n=1 Tax=Aureobasidium vineae TaxID=2773715 RepID=A0A9N8JQT6_9PEZI|nr:unnamed protein product [Aureobasidium vineae]